MKVLLIYDPYAGDGLFANYFDYIINKFQENDIRLFFHRLGEKEDITPILDDMKIEGYSRVIVAAGELIINRVMNYMIEKCIDIPLGIYPVSNYMDYARQLDISESIEDTTNNLAIRNNVEDNIYYINIENVPNLQGTEGWREISFSAVKKAVKYVSGGIVKGIKVPMQSLDTVNDIISVVRDLPRHNNFIYVNKQSIDDDFFDDAEKTLDNGYVYIVLSSTGTPAGNLIGKVTGRQYAHASLSFDEDLTTIVSYNGGNGIYSPGLNQEMLSFFYRKDDANIIIYRLKATREQKQIILNEIKKINGRGSSFNILGFILPYKIRENIMFCSQFVYTMLKAAGIEYFDKRPEDVRPTDFVEKDYHRNLEYRGELFMKDATL